jgi:proteasome lid subunit RPN8/RPN11
MRDIRATRKNQKARRTMTPIQTDPKAPPVPEKTEKALAPAAQQTPGKPETRPAPKPPKKEILRPVLRFSPTAWAKLLYFRDFGDTEVGGFGVTAKDHLLLVEDFVTVRQKVGVVSVSFDDDAVADFFDRQVDAGLKPMQFGRLWLHSHPGNSPHPSGTDEETFARVFGACDWAIMFVQARTGKTYARLRFNVGPATIATARRLSRPGWAMWWTLPAACTTVWRCRATALSLAGDTTTTVRRIHCLG